MDLKKLNRDKTLGLFEQKLIIDTDTMSKCRFYFKRNEFCGI